MSPLAECTNLYSLVLNKTPLETVDLTPLRDLKSLQGLNLSGNQLKTVDMRPLQFCEEMYEVNLEDNPLESLIVPEGFICSPLKLNADDIALLERED